MVQKLKDSFKLVNGWITLRDDAFRIDSILLAYVHSMTNQLMQTRQY